MINIPVLICFLLFGGIATFLWGNILSILDQKGVKYALGWTANNPYLIVRFIKIIKKEPDPKLKREYKMWLWGYFLNTFVGLITLLLTVIFTSI